MGLRGFVAHSFGAGTAAMERGAQMARQRIVESNAMEEQARIQRARDAILRDAVASDRSPVSQEFINPQPSAPAMAAGGYGPPPALPAATPTPRSVTETITERVQVPLAPPAKPALSPLASEPPAQSPPAQPPRRTLKQDINNVANYVSNDVVSPLWRFIGRNAMGASGAALEGFAQAMEYVEDPPETIAKFRDLANKAKAKAERLTPPPRQQDLPEGEVEDMGAPALPKAEVERTKKITRQIAREPEKTPVELLEQGGPSGRDVIQPTSLNYTNNPPKIGRDLARAMDLREKAARRMQIAQQYGAYSLAEQAMAEVAQIDLTMDYLQGMQAIQDFRFGSPRRLEMTIAAFSGYDNVNIIPTKDGKYTVVADGTPVMVGVTRDRLEDVSRRLFDGEYVKQQDTLAAMMSQKNMEFKQELAKLALSKQYDMAIAAQKGQQALDLEQSKTAVTPLGDGYGTAIVRQGGNIFAVKPNTTQLGGQNIDYLQRLSTGN